MALVAPLWATHTAIGFTAGASGAAAVYPVDFVKTQRQTAEGKKEFAGLSLPANAFFPSAVWRCVFTKSTG